MNVTIERCYDDNMKQWNMGSQVSNSGNVTLNGVKGAVTYSVTCQDLYLAHFYSNQYSKSQNVYHFTQIRYFCQDDI